LEFLTNFIYLLDTLGRPKSRWENNIRIDLKVVDINTRRRVNSSKDRDFWRALVNAALNLRVP
jgi:hypothetical protein